ncbi:gliding motility-associated C-terminal domain-containing protein [Filimonas lacunae]|uniref:Gliding motility-associated C-terminal domain-containing protein n=1 Tax=Filimonas lacunae TaxID=477680 RepID=A0A173MGV4_9BACT|nr:gliding motility-associated C-terminal domain-containing protein [Filimonas lacunae]BAV06729.1 Muc19 precursor [Filimonas lacunae]SIT34451.1 gliding motility-associated C-terminal domain-containing protein [Filimonas lacunae]
MRCRFIIWLLVLPAFVQELAAQGLSNRGKEFWTGYGLHQFMELPFGDNSQQMVLYFSAEQPANVKVTVRGRTDSFSKTYPVPANSVIVTDPMPKDGGDYDCRLYDLPPGFGGNGGDGLFHVSIHIESDVPIVAYAHIYGSLSSGATMLMPVETWGYAYTSLNSKQVFEDDCFSFCYVVAQHDNTLVEIIPSVPTRDGKLPGITYYATLDKGDIYQVVGAGMGMGSGLGYELTGTTVRSVSNGDGHCYPIAFFSGSSRTRNPCSAGVLGGDNDMQQVFPYEAWGRRYLTAPLSSTISPSVFMNNIYKVVVRDAATVVKRNNVPLTNFDPASMSYTFESDKGDYIESDKPVLVAQFISGGCLAGGKGDPEMIYLSPLEQGAKRVGFYRNTAEAIERNFVTLIIPKKGFPSLRIDGFANFSHTYTHPRDTNYIVVVKQWASAKAQCLVQSDSSFTAVTYGLGYAESYGYNAGTAINNLHAVLNVHNTPDTTSVVSHPFTCRNTPTELSVLMLYEPTELIWHVSALPGMTPQADITQTNPSPVATVLVNNINYYKYALPGTYQFDTSGIFDLPVTAANPFIENCEKRETIITSITVRPVPEVLIHYTDTGCLSDSVHFAWSPAADGFNASQWYWSFDDGTTANKDSIVKVFTTAGRHIAKLQIVTTEGCIADTAIGLNVYAPPRAAFSAVATACKDQRVTLTDISSVVSGSIVEWHWHYGDGTEDTFNQPAAFSKQYAQPGSYIIQLSVTSDKGCSDDTSQSITIQPLPVADFQLPAAVCMPEGKAVFSNNSSVPGNAALTYQWNFGDGGAVSTAASPTHIYTAKGNYPVSLTVTSPYGCTSSNVQSLTAFYDKPVASFTVVPETLCQGADNRFTDASTATGSTVAAWNWVFADGTTASEPDPVKRYARAGHYPVQLTVTSAAGCTSSTFEKEVIVYVQPVVDAGPSFTVTEGTMVTFQPVTNDSVKVRFQWSPAAELNNAALLHPTYLARADNTFTITATGLEGGCTASDYLTVKLLRDVNVPNIFTPNGDGINDAWDITNLQMYPGCTVAVFNRYGQQVYFSIGYPVAWKGTWNGKLVPAATYYYVIDLKNGMEKLTGSVTIVQ